MRPGRAAYFWDVHLRPSSIRLRTGSRTLLGLLLGAGLLYLVFRQVEPGALLQDLAQVSLPWLLVSMGFSVLSAWFRAWRWQMQLRAAGHVVAVSELFAAVMSGYALNQVLPRAGELGRCTLLYQARQVPLSRSLGTVVVERVLDMAVLLGLAAGVLLWQRAQLLDWLQPSLPAGAGRWGLWAGLAGLLLAAGLWLSRRLWGRWRLVQRGLAFGREMARAALSLRQVRPWSHFALATLLIWACYALMNIAALYSLPDLAGLRLAPWALGLIVLVTGTLGVSVPTPAGLGPYHAAVIFTFVLLDPLGDPARSEATGQVFALIAHGGRVLVLLAGGALAYGWWWWRVLRFRPLEAHIKREVPEAPPVA